MPEENCRLISYIAPGAPATRRPASGTEPFLRPEVGFTPRWYHSSLGIDFGERWHTDPKYRRQTIISMRKELARRFAGTAIGGIDRPERPLDLLTGTYGACTIAAIFGVPIRYAKDNWPLCERQYLGIDETEILEPPDLDRNPFFQSLLSQVDWITSTEGRAEGYVNLQGVLNNAWRLRGEAIFYDLMDAPDRCHRLFDRVCTTMIEATRRLHQRQRQSGVDIGVVTVSNCLVNMISPQQYREFLLPLDKRLAEAFKCIGVHNCAWKADPYMDDYATIPHMGYIDMGLDSDLTRAKRTFPDLRRAIMYTPTDIANKPSEVIREDLEKIADSYGPCDLVAADIDVGTPDERVLELLRMCDEISRTR